MASGLSFVPSSRRVNTSLTQRSRRAVILMILGTLLVGGCGLRLVQLQLIQGQELKQRADQNRIALIPIPADRGNILDRKGRLLASNRLARSIYLHPREESKAEWAKIVPRLATILKIPPAEILAKLEQAGYRSAMPVRISRNLPLQSFIALAEGFIRMATSQRTFWAISAKLP